MQRVRIGLTGLAFVFVLVLLGAVFSSPSQEEPLTPNTIAQPPAPAAGNEAAPEEPLAQLGVAPGNADENQADANQASTVPRQ